MRHRIGIVLAIVMAGVLFFAGSWGYLRLLRLPAPAAPLSGLPAGGGSLLSFHGALAALAAVAATGMLAGILIAAPRISPLAAGLPGLLLIGWTALYLASVRHAVELIPLKSYPSGAGYEAMLFNGILGAAGLAMIIPMFVPSRWRTRDDEAGAEATAAEDYVSSLARTTESQEPAGSADTVQPVRLSLTGGTMPRTPPWSSLDRPAATRTPTELGGGGPSSRRSGRVDSWVLFPVSLREAAATGLVLAALRWAGVVAWLSGCGYGRGGEQVVAVFQFDQHELGHVGPADRVADAYFRS